MQEFSIIQQICIWALPVLLAITIHEAAHGYVASLCGDNTAKMYGRLSFNPAKHIDPIGTILLPIIAGILTQFSFVLGYAKPVPVNWGQLRHPKRDIILVALAGPVSNFIMAFCWTATLKIATYLHPESSMPALFLLYTSKAGILINLVLVALNLLPLPPLDGSRVVSSMLSPQHALAYSKLEPYGFLILLVLILTNVLGYLLIPIINAGYYLLSLIFRL